VENAVIDISFKIVRIPRGVAQIASNTQIDPSTKLSLLTQRFPTLLNHFDAYNATQNTTSNKGLPQAQSPPNVRSPGDTCSIWGSEVDKDEDAWDPVLIISNKHISISKLNLTVENTSFSWLVNMLASVFGEVIKNYVCVQLSSSLVTGSSMLLGQVNSVIGDNWQTISQVSSIICDSRPLFSVDLRQVLGIQNVESVVGSVSVCNKADVEDLYSLCGYMNAGLNGIGADGAMGDTPAK
jgi:hypothetical protein